MNRLNLQQEDGLELGGKEHVVFCCSCVEKYNKSMYGIICHGVPNKWFIFLIRWLIAIVPRIKIHARDRDLI